MGKFKAGWAVVVNTDSLHDLTGIVVRIVGKRYVVLTLAGEVECKESELQGGPSMSDLFTLMRGEK